MNGWYGARLRTGLILAKYSLIEMGGYRKDFLEDWYMNEYFARKYKFKYINQILFCCRWYDSHSIKNAEYIRTIQDNIKEFVEAERKSRIKPAD